MSNRKEILMSRRSVLAATAVGGPGLGIGLGEVDARQKLSSTTTGFSSTSSGTSANLNAVVRTMVGPLAVGSGGEVLQRTTNGWKTVLDSGIRELGKTLKDASVTRDGKVVFVCGGSGSVGAIDLATGQTYNFSEPMGMTSTFTAVDVSGDRDAVDIGLADSNGTYLYGEGAPTCSIRWGRKQMPNGSNALNGVDLKQDGSGALVGASGNIFNARGEGRAMVGDGISNFSGTLNDVIDDSSMNTVSVGNSGIVARKDGGSWSTTTVASSALNAVSRDADGSELVTVGGSGEVYAYDGSNWTKKDLDTSTQFRGVSVTDSTKKPDTIVGKSGTVYERGSYNAEPHTIEITCNVSTSVDYEFSVTGSVSKASSADSDDSINQGTVSGSISGSGSIDAYIFSGKAQDFAVTSGSNSDLSIKINDSEVDIERLLNTSWVRLDDTTIPTSKTLHGVVESSSGIFAVGGGGKVLQRKDTGWEVVVSSGPGGNGNNLYTATSTDGGDHVWFGGSSGALGYYDLGSESVNNETAPSNVTNTMSAIAVLGSAGNETVIVGTSSGQILRGTMSNGSITWDDPYKPGTGSAINGIDNRGTEFLFCDGNSDVFHTLDTADNWRKISPTTASGTPNDIAIGAQDDMLMAAGSGYGYHGSGSMWTPFKLGGNARYAAARSGNRKIIVGSSGEIFERNAREWEQTADIGSYTLRGLTIPSSAPEMAFAVGSSGTVVVKKEV